MDTGGQNGGAQQSPSEGVAARSHRMENVEHGALVVKQPEKIKSLLIVLGDIERISERITEDASHDLGAGGGAGAQGGRAQAAATQISLRRQALQLLPATSVMRAKLVTHLQKEVRHLEREAKHIARAAGKGSACVLTRLYAQIRKIQSLITEILEAAAELVERLYVRLFIDHQQLV